MNAGLLSGLLAPQRGPRWHRWEAVAGPLYGTTQPTARTQPIPIPPHVAAVRVTACGGAAASGATNKTTGSGAAAKGVIFPVNGREIYVRLGGGNVDILVMPAASNVASAASSTISVANAEYALSIQAGFMPAGVSTGGTIYCYHRGATILQLNGATTMVPPDCRMWMNGMVSAGFGGGHNVPNGAVGATINPSIIYATDATNNATWGVPSLLFGPDLAFTLPGAGARDASGGQTPAYVLLEWME